MPRTELTKRLAVAAVGIPLVVVILFLGRWAIGPALALFCAGAAVELYRMAEGRGIEPLRVVGAAAAATLILVAMALPTLAAAAPVLWSITLLFLLGSALAAIWLRGPERRPALAVAVTALGALIPGGAMAFIIFLRHLPLPEIDPSVPNGETWAGVALVAYPLAVTWMTDSAAFFAGKRWGRRKLIPSVSPGKTVEGAVAGLVGGTLGGWLVARFVFEAWLGVPLSPVAGAAGGLLIAVISQAGDLAESVWKREAGVKDSGTFFPGHGGILDRMDSLLFTVPAAYAWLALLLGGGSA